MEDDEIIKLFWNRSEDAINQTDIKYGRLCLDLAHGILKNTADSEECVNDTYLAVWNAVPPEIPNNFKAYICSITRHLSLKRLEYNTAMKRNPNLIISLEEISNMVGDESIADKIEDIDIAQSISRCLRMMKPEYRKVFVRRYYFFDSISDISERYNYSESKVKAILFRTRKKLKSWLIKEGITI